MLVVPLAASRISQAVLDPANLSINSSLTQRLYNYFKDPSNPVLIKISLIAIGVLAILAAGYFLGMTLLPLSIVVILGAAFEVNRLRQEESMADLKREMASLRLRYLLSGQDRFLDDVVEVLDIGDRESPTGDIDFIQLDEVPRPRRGVDKYGRQFYAFHIESNEDDFPQVIVLFQKYTTGDVWHISGPPDFARGVLNEGARDQIVQLIFDHNHPRYHLPGEPMQDIQYVPDFD
ncbi:MAG: hypothetical protein K1X28_07820 [Parachlamydiales bacterium]|nr:hypothetical protein [Parachlamydiales bacterium]